MEAHTEVKVAGQELEEKKLAVTDAEDLIATTSDAKLRKQKMM